MLRNFLGNAVEIIEEKVCITNKFSHVYNVNFSTEFGNIIYKIHKRFDCALLQINQKQSVFIFFLMKFYELVTMNYENFASINAFRCTKFTTIDSGKEQFNKIFHLAKTDKQEYSKENEEMQEYSKNS